ncbi:MAG: PaaI family thioesterase [Actinomycetota bacterium]
MTVAAPASLWFTTGFGTLDLKVHFLRPVTPDGRDLSVRATVEQRGRTIAVSTARIDDADGKRVAMATGSAMISEGRPWPAVDA